MFAAIDDRLIGVAGRIAGHAESRGLDQWEAARHCLAASLAAVAVAAVAAGLAGTVGAERLGDLATLVAIMALVVWVCWSELARQAASRLGAQTALLAERLPRRLTLVATVAMAVPLAGKAPLLLAGFLAFQAHFYLKACQPRPPERRTRLATRIG